MSAKIKTALIIVGVVFVLAAAGVGIRVMQAGSIPVHARMTITTERGHKAHLSTVRKEGFFGSKTELYLFEVEMALPDGRILPIAQHEVPVRHILGKIYWEEPERHMRWSKEKNAFILETDRGPIEVQVPY